MEIRPFRESDEKGIRALFRICFHKELSYEEWLWKYKGSYLGSSSFVAEDEGKIIAHYGGFRMRFYSGGRVLNAYQGCDVMTHPKYRARIFSKKGIIVKTAEAFYTANPMEFIFGFPPERHGRLMTLQLKFEKHRFIHVMKKDRDNFKTYRNPFLRGETGWNRISPDEIDTLWVRAKDSYALSIEKDSRYILWRYRDNPQGKYEIITFRGVLKKDLKAYVIIRIENDELNMLDVLVTREVDFMTTLAAMEHLARKREVKNISLWVNPAEGIYQDLRNAGYRKEDGIPYTLRVFEGSGISPEFFLDHYCYRRGDYDAA